MALVILQCMTPKRSRRRKNQGKSGIEQPLIDDPQSDTDPLSTVKVGPTVTSACKPEFKHELTAAQIEILKRAAPFTISVKFSDLKFREGKRTFSFSTKIAKLPKLVGEKRSSDASDSYFEFTRSETPNDDVEENQWKSPWVSKGQPATFVF